MTIKELKEILENFEILDELHIFINNGVTNTPFEKITIEETVLNTKRGEFIAINSNDNRVIFHG